MERLLSAVTLSVVAALLFPAVAVHGFVGDVVCLGCHDGNNPQVDKSGYLLTGHKKVLRRVTAGEELFGPTGDNNSSYSETFDWPTGQHNGVDLYYLIGGWTADGDPDVVTAGGSYRCGRCHATGYVEDSAPVAGLEPWVTLGDAPAIRAIFDLSDIPPANYPSWAGDGVQCERCHGEAFAGAIHHGAGPGYVPLIPYRTASTVFCHECHGQERPENFSGTGLPEIRVGAAGGYAADFADYSRTVEFLNSPHARFTGLASEIGEAALYDSQFAATICLDLAGAALEADNQTACETLGGVWDGVSVNRGCAGCHDVHQSTVAATGATGGIVNNCGIQCHAPETGNPDPEADPDYDGYSGFHDGLGGTAPDTISTAGITPTNPEGRGTNPRACAQCHMGRGATHLWEIDLTPGYTPFPDEAAYNNGQETALRNQAGHVVMDVDLACRQCHGGSGPASVVLTRHEAAVFASNYHRTGTSYDFNANGPNATGARFNWYRGGGCNTVLVDGTMNASTCSWSAPDATMIDDNESCLATITFGAPGHYDVTLTTGKGERTLGVNASGNNLLPTAAYTITTSAAQTGDETGMTAKLTDGSSANGCGGEEGFGTAIWGDGTVTAEIPRGGSTTHEYTIKGTYSVTYSFRDAVNNRKNWVGSKFVTVPDEGSALFDISGSIILWTDGNGNGIVDDNETGGFHDIMVELTKPDDPDWGRRRSRSINGAYIFTNVETQFGDAPYMIKPIKYGYIFTPASLPASNGPASGGHTGKDFIATPTPLFDIRGYITLWTDGNGNGIVDDNETSGLDDGAEVRLTRPDDPGWQTQPAPVKDGYYVFYKVETQLDDAPYVIEPIKGGYTFTPATLEASNGPAGGGHVARDFTARPL